MTHKYTNMTDRSRPPARNMTACGGPETAEKPNEKWRRRTGAAGPQFQSMERKPHEFYRACVRAYVRACVSACVRACVMSAPIARDVKNSFRELQVAHSIMLEICIELV